MFERRLSVVVDCDDVLMPCNEYALELLKKEDGISYDISEVTDWGPVGAPVDERLRFYERASFFATQTAFPGAAEFLDELLARVDLMMATAVNPKFMGQRIGRIAELFPSFPLDRVMIGTRKEVVKCDVMLDDGLHNVLRTDCALPVLFDQPWNRSVSGICRVRGYAEFLTLIDMLLGRAPKPEPGPKLVCLVGPSGGGKHAVADWLCHDPRFVRIPTMTTSCENRAALRRVGADEFRALREGRALLESAHYSGDWYGVLGSDVRRAVDGGSYAVAVMDSSGCASARHVLGGRCAIAFVDRAKRECVDAILRKEGVDRARLVDRIMSIDHEKKNSVLADGVVEVSGSDFKAAAEAVKKIALGP